MTKKKKCYLAENTCCEEEGAYGIVAYSVKEALELARNSDYWDGCESRFVNTRARLQKGIDVTDLDVGEIDNMDGLKKGIYSSVRCVDCDVCKEFVDEDESAYLVNNQIMCKDCEEKFLSSKNSK